MNRDDVSLEGGDRDGQRVPLAAMTREGISAYVLPVGTGVYRHDEESVADFNDGHRVAVFEPAAPAATESAAQL